MSNISKKIVKFSVRFLNFCASEKSSVVSACRFCLSFIKLMRWFIFDDDFSSSITARPVRLSINEMFSTPQPTKWMKAAKYSVFWSYTCRCGRRLWWGEATYIAWLSCCSFFSVFFRFWDFFSILFVTFVRWYWARFPYMPADPKFRSTSIVATVIMWEHVWYTTFFVRRLGVTK